MLHLWIMWLTPLSNAPTVSCPYCAKLTYPDETQQKQGVAKTKTALWPGQLATVMAAWGAYIDPQRSDDPAQKAVTYYTHNQIKKPAELRQDSKFI